MTKSKIFFILCLSFISGVLSASFFQEEVFLTRILVILGLIILTVGYRRKVALAAGLSLLLFAGGFWRTVSAWEKIPQGDSPIFLLNQKVMVIEEPQTRENYKNIIVSSGKNDKFLVRVESNSEINFGDELLLSCTLKMPQNRGNFDYKMYLAKDKIYYICQNAEIKKTGENRAGWFYSSLLKLKNLMTEKIHQAIPYPQSALAAGLIFGGDSELPAKLKDNFSRTGMTHIVAVSGYNVTILAEYLIWLGIFLGLWRPQAFWFAFWGIIAFVVMIGFPSSAVRAGIMGILLVWAMKKGRLANSWNAIALAAVMMLIINPLLLRWDIGFQLSFLATLGIISFAPWWENILARKNKALGFTEILFLTLSAQIFVLPVILHNFHTLPLVSLPANLLVLPVIPLTMLLSFFTAVAGLISPIFSQPLGWLTYLPLKYEVWVIETLGELSWASKSVDDFKAEGFFIWYLFLFLIVLFVRRKSVLRGKSDRVVSEKNF